MQTDNKQQPNLNCIINDQCQNKDRLLLNKDRSINTYSLEKSSNSQRVNSSFNSYRVHQSFEWTQLLSYQQTQSKEQTYKLIHQNSSEEWIYLGYQNNPHQNKQTVEKSLYYAYATPPMNIQQIQLFSMEIKKQYWDNAYRQIITINISRNILYPQYYSRQIKAIQIGSKSHILKSIANLNLYHLQVLKLTGLFIQNIQSISFLKSQFIQQIDLTNNKIISLKPLLKTNFKLLRTLSIWNNFFNFQSLKWINRIKVRNDHQNLINKFNVQKCHYYHNQKELFSKGDKYQVKQIESYRDNCRKGIIIPFEIQISILKVLSNNSQWNEWFLQMKKDNYYEPGVIPTNWQKLGFGKSQDAKSYKQEQEQDEQFDQQKIQFGQRIVKRNNKKKSQIFYI